MMQLRTESLRPQLPAGLEGVQPSDRKKKPGRKKVAAIKVTPSTDARKRRLGDEGERWALAAAIFYTFEALGLLDKVELRTIKQRQKFTLGPFEIEFIHVSHSLIECVALAIRTPVGVIVHTGDFKVDDTPVIGGPIDLSRLTAYGDEGVLALLADSTNVEREGRTGSEKAVIPAFDKIFDDAAGRVIRQALADTTLVGLRFVPGESR